MSLKMRKMVTRGGIFFFLAPVLLVLSSASFLRAEDMPSAAQARIVSSEGDVTVKTSAGSMTATKGAMLDQGAEIMVGENSSSLITLGEGRKSSITVDGGSDLMLTSLDPVKINLKSGKLVALVTGLTEGSTFQVITPTATATARGTKFLITDGVIAVLEGLVDVETGGQTIQVGANQQLSTGEGSSGTVTGIDTANANDIDNASEAASAESGSAGAQESNNDAQTNAQISATP